MGDVDVGGAVVVLVLVGALVEVVAEVGGCVDVGGSVEVGCCVDVWGGVVVVVVLELHPANASRDAITRARTSIIPRACQILFLIISSYILPMDVYLTPVLTGCKSYNSFWFPPDIINRHT